MPIRRTIDGTVEFTDDELIELVKTAYTRTKKIPSRGVWGYNQHYASATGAIEAAFGSIRSLLGVDYHWLVGFNYGFEHTFGTVRMRTEEFNRGFFTGKAVAEAIFSWPDSPKVE